MSTGMVKEQNLDKQIHKQMGCMTGFLQIFDRHQILSGKRHYSAKRLPPSPVVDTASESERSAPPSPAVSERPKPSPAAIDNLPPQSPLRLEMREVTRSPWKFGKETPRLSLDSRATTDAKGGLHPREIRTGGGGRCESISSDATDDSQNHRSPSVIARLMGLEPLQDSSLSEPESKPQLRRSASESRVTRDLFQSRFTSEKPIQSQSPLFPTIAQDGTPASASARYSDPRGYTLRGAHNGIEPPKRFNSSSPWKSPQLHRRGFYDSGDFFPETKLAAAAASEYVEIESRLRFRGIDEPSRDLDTLKQILEALQLKGLLHSRKPPDHNQVRHRNFIYDESPVVIVRTPRSSNSSTINRRRGINCSPPSGGRNQINYVSHSLARSPSRRSPSPISTARNESNTIGRKSNSLARPKPLSVETQRRKNEPVENRRASPVQSPKLSPRRTGLDPTGSHSPRRKKSTAQIHHKQKMTTVVSLEDESSSISGSSITTSTDTEKSKAEDYKEGRHLLERCDKLLHSIAVMTATDMQPSPVSVLDSSFYKDESSTPSPVTTRRIIDFKDQSNEGEDEMWTPPKDSSDFAYVSDILRVDEKTDSSFVMLEKQQCLKGKDSSKSSRLERKLVFDTINEILDRKKKLPPWKVTKVSSVTNVWSELERIRAREEHCDLFETVCGVLRKDMALGLDGWDECHVEISDSILDIERLVFKDLITETIREMAKSNVLPRRKLLF